MARFVQGLILLFATFYGSSVALVCYSCQTWYNPTGSEAGKSVWNTVFFVQKPNNAACKAGTINETATGCDVCLYQDTTLTVQLLAGGSTSVSLYQRACIKASDIPNYDKSTIPKNKCTDSNGYTDDPLSKVGLELLKAGFNSVGLLNGGVLAGSVAATAGGSCMCNDVDKCNDKEPTGAGADFKSSPLLMSVLMMISLLFSCKFVSR